MSIRRGRPKGLSKDKKSYGPLGDIIRKYRMEKKMGLADVAKACKCSVQFISNIEHGRAPLPWDKAQLLAQVLGIPSSELHAANMAIRSDFKSFIGTSSKNKKSVKKSVTALKSLQETASLVALTAKDAQLKDLIELYTAASASNRKKIFQSAKKIM